MTAQAQNMHVPAESGPAYWGPGDRYTFLVTGAQSGGAYFILEAFVPLGGGPPHIHQREEECFYLLDGHLTMTLGEQQLKVSAGDFVQIARDAAHLCQRWRRNRADAGDLLAGRDGTLDDRSARPGTRPDQHTAASHAGNDRAHDRRRATQWRRVHVAPGSQHTTKHRGPV